MDMFTVWIAVISRMIPELKAQCHCGASKVISTDDQAGSEYIKEKKAEIREFEKRHQGCKK
ncbi:MAG: hypothetical protein LLG05_12395 [Porphyromonadaceae bacterium]|nr:hypothetical protein [Porphyromonadaceae bacterium]